MIWQDHLTEADTRAGRYEPGVTMSMGRGGDFKSSSASEGELLVEDMSWDASSGPGEAELMAQPEGGRQRPM